MAFETNVWLETATDEELLNELNLTNDESLKGEIEAQLDYRKEKGE
jgi:hypothetical protein